MKPRQLDGLPYRLTIYANETEYEVCGEEKDLVACLDAFEGGQFTSGILSITGFDYQYTKDGREQWPVHLRIKVEVIDGMDLAQDGPAGRRSK